MDNPDHSSGTINQTDCQKSLTSEKPAQSSVEMASGEAPSNPASAPEPTPSKPSVSSSESDNTFQRLFERADYDAIAEILEREELESPQGIPASLVYERLLAIYLLQNDFYNAKLLWKRIPASTKPADSQLSILWSVGQKMAQSDFPGIYEALRGQSWKNNENLQKRMMEVTRQRAVQLVAKAYESITIANLGALLGTSGCAEETKKAALEMKWDVEGDMVFPKTIRADGGRGKVANSDVHLGLLTDYVSFLESH